MNFIVIIIMCILLLYSTTLALQKYIKFVVMHTSIQNRFLIQSKLVCPSVRLVFLSSTCRYLRDGPWAITVFLLDFYLFVFHSFLFFRNTIRFSTS